VHHFRLQHILRSGPVRSGPMRSADAGDAPAPELKRQGPWHFQPESFELFSSRGRGGYIFRAALQSGA
jgi:hypothetical protein